MDSYTITIVAREYIPEGDAGTFHTMRLRSNKTDKVTARDMAIMLASLGYQVEIAKNIQE